MKIDEEANYPKTKWNNVRGRFRYTTHLKNLLPGLLIGFSLSTIIFHYVLYPQLQLNNNNTNNDNNMDNNHSNYNNDSTIFMQRKKLENLPDNETVADLLFREVKVLCWVMTNPDNHKTKARSIQRTWGKRCNKLIFMSTEKDDELNTIVLNVKEGREYLWNKLREAFKYVYNNYIDDYDWFLRADDDTYVILENLRYMLYSYSKDMPIHFGYKFKPYTKQGYFSGGAGVVLSQKALSKFIVEALPYSDRCRKEEEGADDVEIGKCLDNVNVLAGDTRDSLNRSRFLPFVPQDHLFMRQETFWYHDYAFYEIKTGYECCSNNVVTFHYTTPEQMHVYEYLIYHVRPYGILFNTPPLGKRLTEGEFNVLYNHLKVEVSITNGSVTGERLD